jgi:hypothetical protein
MMAWYWDVFMTVVAFNIVFVLLALLLSIIRDSMRAKASAGREEAYLSQECILHFLRTLHLAINQKET